MSHSPDRVGAWMLENQKRYHDRISLQHAAAEACHTTAKYASAKMRLLEDHGELRTVDYLPIGQKPAAPQAATGLDETALRQKLDKALAFETFLRTIPAGRFFSEYDVVLEAGLRGQPYRHILDDPRFEAFRGKAEGTVYWGHPDRIAALKADRILR